MKINVFISVVKAVSAWLHGEGGKHFRTYTYPRIKSITRRFFNFGIYEYIEGFYKIVDDTYYKGAIEVEPQDPLEVIALEQLAEKIEESDGFDDKGATLPKFADIRSKLPIWKGLEQGKTYRCGTFTMNNMLRTAMLGKGLKPPLEVTAIDPLYIATKSGKGKEGTVMNNAFAYLAKKGFPIASWTPSMTNHDKELDALENSKVISNAALFPTVKATGQVKATSNFEEAVALDASLPENWLMQVSINFSASLKYFGQLVPYVQKINGAYSFTRTGGHSVHGVRHSFSTFESGEAGFAIIDSAYRSSEEGWRFLTSKLFTYKILTVRFVELAIDGTTVTPTPTPVPTPTPADPVHVLATANISFGETSENVKELQRFLIEQGYHIVAGVTGYFGKETKSTLKAWQDIQFGPKYTGEYWGEISQARYRQLKGL